MNKNIRRQPIRIWVDEGKYKVYTRMVRDAQPTGVDALTMARNRLFQWEGWVKLLRSVQHVWGWSHHYDVPPTEWSNDRG